MFSHSLAQLVSSFDRPSVHPSDKTTISAQQFTSSTSSSPSPSPSPAVAEAEPAVGKQKYHHRFGENFQIAGYD